MTRFRAIDITQDFLTSQGGLSIGKQIETLFRENPVNNIEISFDGVEHVAPSFVNGAFLYLIDNYGEDYFRSKVKVINSSSDVAKTISSSVRTYIDHQKTFYSNLQTNKIFVIHDGSEQDQTFIDALKKIGDQKGFVHLSNPTPGIFSDLTKAELNRADAILGIVNQSKKSDVFFKQLELAADLKKPCIILQNRGLPERVSSSLLDRVQVIYFDDDDFINQLNKLNQLLVKYRKDVTHSSSTPAKSDFSNETALFAVLAIALLVALFFALSQEDSKKNNS